MTEELFSKICAYSNLELAYKKARKHKTLKSSVISFENNLKENLQELRIELLLHAYRPKPLQTFILCDPKTRKISKSDFRDRVVHHTLCNIIEPSFEKSFIYDSYANRIGKGTLKAIERFDYFKRKATHNFSRKAYVLKADIRHYFEEVDHKVLLGILKRTIKDTKIMALIKIILKNYNSGASGKGMPLGNLTSQFFANVYLNELDQFVKHKLKAKNYIRYVDDFVLLHHSWRQLISWKKEINSFLSEQLSLKLHPYKCKIIPLTRGVNFLGLRIFPYNRLVNPKNLIKVKTKFEYLCELHKNERLNYDQIYDLIEGWVAYVKNANTHKLKKKVTALLENRFPHEISTKEINRYNKWV